MPFSLHCDQTIPPGLFHHSVDRSSLLGVLAADDLSLRPERKVTEMLTIQFSRLRERNYPLTYKWGEKNANLSKEKSVFFKYFSKSFKQLLFPVNKRSSRDSQPASKGGLRTIFF